MTPFALVRKNLFRKKLRAALMMASIFIAFLIFGVLMSFLSAFNSGTEAAPDDRLVTVNKINFTQTLPYAYFNRIKSTEGVEAASHANWFGGYYQDPRNQVVTFAVEPESWLRLYPEIIITDEEREDWLGRQNGILVGAGAAQRLGWKVGDQVPLFSNIYSQEDGSRSWDFIISGIFEGRDKNTDTTYVIFHYDYFNETISFGRDQIGWVVLRTTSAGMNEIVADRIDAQFANSQAETSTATEKAFNQAFIAQLGNIALIVGLVVSAAFVTILLIVGNTMVMAIRERTKEIGVMKTLGFSGPRILRMVLGEAVLLSLIGGLLGLGAATLAVAAIGQALGGFIPGLRMTLETTLQALGVMLVLGLITGGLPAFNAMRLPIVTALSRR